MLANSSLEESSKVKQRMMVENYKRHFKEMKTRLREYSVMKSELSKRRCVDSTLNEDTDQGLHCVNALRRVGEERKIQSGQHLALVEVHQNSPLQEKIRTNIQNYDKENVPKIIKQKKDLKRVTGFTELEKNGRSNKEEESYQTQIQENQKNFQKSGNFCNAPLFSFRGPDDGKNVNLIPFAYSNPATCPEETTQVGLSSMECSYVEKRVQNPCNLIDTSISSPKAGQPTKHVGSTKNHILIDLSSIERSKSRNHSKDDIIETSKLQDKTAENFFGETNFDFDAHFEAIKAEAIASTFSGELLQDKGCDSRRHKSISTKLNFKKLSKDDIHKFSDRDRHSKKPLKSEDSGSNSRHDKRRPARLISPSGRFRETPKITSERHLLSSRCSTMPCYKGHIKAQSRPNLGENSLENSVNQGTPNFFKSSLDTRRQSHSYFCKKTSQALESTLNISKFDLMNSQKKMKDLTAKSLFLGKGKTASRKSSAIKFQDNSHQKMTVSAAQSPNQQRRVELISRLARGERAKVTKVDMIKLTKKNYLKLPEVQEREKSKSSQRGLAAKMERVKEYDLVRLFDKRR
jgi:hypothetical protein